MKEIAKHNTAVLKKGAILVERTFRERKTLQVRGEGGGREGQRRYLWGETEGLDSSEIGRNMHVHH